METANVKRLQPTNAQLSVLAASGFDYDLSFNATFRRRPGGLGGSALGSSRFGRPY